MNKAVFVDASAWFALVVPSDPNHIRAVDWLTANPAPLVTTDYVVDETLTLLRARDERNRAIVNRQRVFRWETGGGLSAD
ncbi:MAG: type II toxin-antitoxin system VapC family toxin [Blastocatellia bacterium]